MNWSQANNDMWNISQNQQQQQYNHQWAQWR